MYALKSFQDDLSQEWQTILHTFPDFRSMLSNTDNLRTLFQRLYQAILTLPESCCQTILTYSELISNSIHTFTDLLPNNSKHLFEKSEKS